MGSCDAALVAGRPVGKVQWRDTVSSLNSDRPERMENVIKSFVPCTPGNLLKLFTSLHQSQ